MRPNPKKSYKSKIKDIRKSAVGFGNGCDLFVFILHTDDLIIDGSNLYQEDADEIIRETAAGFSWHYEDAVELTDNKEVRL